MLATCPCHDCGVSSTQIAPKIEDPVEYSLLALLSGGLLGAWQFGIGLYRGTMTRNMVLLISATAAGVGYFLLAALSQSLSFDIDDVPEGLIGGVLNVSGTLCLLKAFECGKIGVASGVAATSTLVPVAYSLYLGEPLTFMTSAGLFCILIGLALFYGAHLRDGGGDTEGSSSGKAIWFALGTALFWGTAIIVLDVGTLESVTSTMAVSQIPQVILAAILVLIGGAGSRVGISRASTTVLIASGFALALSNTLFYFAANMSDIGVVSVLASLSPIVTALLALAVFKEKLVRLEWAALVVVIIGTGLVLY